MDASRLTISLGDVIHTTALAVTIDVKTSPLFRVRMFIGSQFLRLGAWIIGMGSFTLYENPNG